METGVQVPQRLCEWAMPAQSSRAQAVSEQRMRFRMSPSILRPARRSDIPSGCSPTLSDLAEGFYGPAGYPCYRL